MLFWTTVGGGVPPVGWFVNYVRYVIATVGFTVPGEENTMCNVQHMFCKCSEETSTDY